MKQKLPESVTPDERNQLQNHVLKEQNIQLVLKQMAMEREAYLAKLAAKYGNVQVDVETGRITRPPEKSPKK